MPSKATVYAIGIILIGLPILGYSFVSTLSEPYTWLLLAAGAAFSGVFPVRLPRLGAKTDSLRVTASDIFVFLGILMFSPATGVAVGAIDSAVGNLRTRSALRYLFNLSLASIATFCAGSLFYTIRGSSPPLDPVTVVHPVLFLGLVALCALFYFALASTILSTAVSLQTGTSWIGIWKQDVFWSALIGFTQAVAAAAIVLGSGTTQILMVGVLVPIVLITYYAHRLHGDRLRTAEHSRAFLQSTLDSLSMAVAILDESGKILATNAVWSGSPDDHPLIGQSIGEDYVALCRSARDGLTSDAHALASGLEAVVRARRSSFNLEYRWRTGEDSRWFSVNVTRFKEAPLRLVVAHEEITERKQAQLRILRLSYFDVLTGLPNQDLLRERLAALTASARPGVPRGAILSLNLDNFRKVNDTLGHRAGDRVLQETAQRLLQCLGWPERANRPEELAEQILTNKSAQLVFRTAGDDFCILLDRVEHPEEVVELAEQIIESMTQPFDLDGHETFVTVSIGIAFPIRNLESSDQLRAANSARRRAKERGKNTFEFYSETFHTHARRALTIESSLYRALERNELSVRYQPRIALSDGRVVGMEALMRWNHPDMGMVSPGDFIPISEETGLVVPFGRWILESACRQNRIWADRGHRLCLSVNVSSEQFKRDDLVGAVQRALDSSRLDPALLELEITETLLMEDQQEVRDVLNRIRQLGVRIALDDFGTGYSALVYLARFPVDTVKIDRSFIRQVDSKAEHQSIVRAIIALCRSLNLGVVAEGVETEEQLRFLRRERCHEVQGFLFSPPQESKAFFDWMADYATTRRSGDVGLAGTG